MLISPQKLNIDLAGARWAAPEPSIYSFGHFFQLFKVVFYFYLGGYVFAEPFIGLAPIVDHKHNNHYKKPNQKKHHDEKLQ